MNAAAPAPDTVAAARLTIFFIKSIQEVLSMMASTKVEVGKPFKKTDLSATYDVSGIIGFSGDFVGSMVLSFRADAAMGIVKSFTGMEMANGSAEFADAIGELANMVAGSAKKSFGGTSISIPSVVMGTGHMIGRLANVPCIVIPCTCPQGSFVVEVNVKSNK
jgi:chemotaxis protein CheX